MIEFALILPLMLFVILGGSQLALLAFGRMALLHAAQEGAVAGAQEPRVPERCDVATAIVTKVLGHEPQDVKCTEPGNIITLDVRDEVAVIVPFLASGVIDVSARAVARTQ